MMTTKTKTPVKRQLPGGGTSSGGTLKRSIPDVPGIDKYKTYEYHKKYLRHAGLLPGEYESAVQKLAKQLGI